MTDEELTNLSKKLFAEVVNRTEFPQNVKVEKQEDDTFLFIQELSNNLGSAIFCFKPSLLFLKEYIKDPQRLEPAVGKNLTEELTFLFGQTILYSLLTNFHLEIEETFTNFFETPFLLLNQMFDEAFTKAAKGKPIEELNIAQKLIKKSKDNVDEIINNRARKLRNRIKSQLNPDEEVKVPNKYLIGYFYTDLLLDWKKAKKFYKQNSKFPNWMEMALLGFPDFPHDLILRLESPDSYFSMPSSIALEHAARLAGFKNDSLELRTLQNYLKESRKWLKDKSEEAKREEIKSYISSVAEKVMISLKISESLEQEFTLDDYPLIHQLFLRESMKTEPVELFIDYFTKN